MRKTRIFFLLTLFFTLAAGHWLLAQDGPPGDILAELKLFSRAMSAILEGYVEDVQPRRMFYEAVRGMTRTLDKYSEFIDPERYELLKIDMKGEYAGIGTWLGEDQGFIVVKNIKPGTPADKADIRIDDRILRIDGISIAGKAIHEVASLLRGEPETAVLLSLFRPATEKTFDVNLVRERIEIEAVRDVRMVGRSIGYMNVSEWNEHTIEQIDAALEQLDEKGMKALIIDLRNNAGGILGSALELSSRFLTDGEKIVSVSSKIDVQRAEHFAKGDRKVRDVPLVILVNERSASASEIFSAAMQDHGRAVLVGAKTYGKASVQSVVPLDEVSAMRLTTARYVSPHGRQIDNVGIAPDVEIEDGNPDNPGAQNQIKKAIEIFSEYY